MVLGGLERRQVQHYEEHGWCAIPALLTDAAELREWREAVAEAVETQLSWSEAERERMRVEQACFHNQAKAEGDGETRAHYSQVFVQAVNLWKTTPRMRKLVLDPRLGKIAAEAGQCSGIHLYHDHALIKQPWAPATNWHIDNPGDPFTSIHQVMLWVALDDASISNGCMHFINGSHKHAGFPVENDIQATFEQARGGSGLGGTDIAGCLPNFPEWEGLPIGYGEVQAGGAILLSGALAHSAGPNMSFATRRAMAFVFMPEGAVKDENHGAIPDELVNRVPVGEVLCDDEHLPLLWSSRHPKL
jgi:phytanoyl-CoA hydroxylase